MACFGLKAPQAARHAFPICPSEFATERWWRWQFMPLSPLFTAKECVELAWAIDQRSDCRNFPSVFGKIVGWPRSRHRL